MAISANQNEFALAVCDALGLKSVTRLEIVFDVNEAVTVTAQFLAEDALETVTKRFELSAVEK